jgi:hypothetical protein
MARELSKNPTVLIVNDTIFAHGGVMPVRNLTLAQTLSPFFGPGPAAASESLSSQNDPDWKQQLTPYSIAVLR